MDQSAVASFLTHTARINATSLRSGDKSGQGKEARRTLPESHTSICTQGSTHKGSDGFSHKDSRPLLSIRTFTPFSPLCTDGFIFRQTPRFVHKLLIHTIISYICTSSRFNILSLPVRFTIADHVQTNSSPTTLSITT